MIFADLVRGWQFYPAEQIIDVSHHAGFIVLYAVMHYFEMIAKFKDGFTGYNKIPTYFKKGLIDAAQGAINGMSREALILGVVKAVVREPPLLFQVKDERPDFLASDSCYVCACFLKGEKILKIVNAISDDVYGTGAFTLRNGTELITSEEATYVRARF
jgi:hypothetical protein